MQASAPGELHRLRCWGRFVAPSGGSDEGAASYGAGIFGAGSREAKDGALRRRGDPRDRWLGRRGSLRVGCGARFPSRRPSSRSLRSLRLLEAQRDPLRELRVHTGLRPLCCPRPWRCAASLALWGAPLLGLDPRLIADRRWVGGPWLAPAAASPTLVAGVAARPPLVALRYSHRVPPQLGLSDRFCAPEGRSS